MFEGQPKGLYALALANTGERFGYYTMLAIFALFMQAKFGWTESQAGQVYAIFLAVVYFAPLFGGMIADKIGYGKCVTIWFCHNVPRLSGSCHPHRGRYYRTDFHVWRTGLRVIGYRLVQRQSPGIGR